MEFLTPEEEYELQYADDLDVLSAMEIETGHDEAPEIELHEPDLKNGIFAAEHFLKNVTGDSTDTLDSAKRQFKECKDPIDVSPKKKRFKISDESLNENKETSPLKASDNNCEGPSTSNAAFVHCITDNQDYEPIPITKSDGTIKYMKCYEIKQDAVVSNRDVSGLLQRPLIDMKMEILSKLENAKIFQEISHSHTKKKSQSENKGERDELWVEKYQPEAYTELLSDEGVNRSLLRWLKLWDKVVFNREQKVRDRTKFSSTVKKPSFQFRKPLIELDVNLDEHSRPTKKIVLLCGPPGLGKTTLANIIARLAGYNVVEMNASDDRSPEIFRQRLEAATQMKAMLDKECRPNCLVIDEIDGAPSPAINILVSFVKSIGFSKGKRKKGEFPLLKRPIICICNDQYAVALKPLRQIALILNFPPTKKDRLATRIFEVATQEGLETDYTSLLLLCENLENDIRSCLSTIQFFAKTGKQLRSSEIRGMEVGLKDVHKSLFAVWKDIFHLSNTSSFTNVLRTVQNFGDFEKIAIGIHENYLKVRLKTTHAENITKGADWFCYADIMNRSVYQTQAYYLMSYLPYVAVAFHTFFATTSHTYISYPSPYYEFLSKKSLRLKTLTSVTSDMITSLKNFLDATLLIVDIIPMLVEIIKPLLRPINIYLFTQREKSELKRVVDVMIAFNLCYTQERTMEGNYIYKLEPDLEELVCFKDVKKSSDLLYAVKQMISREVTMEKMRRSDPGPVEKVKVPEPKKEVEPPKKKPLVDKPYRDFFGRKIEVTKDKKSVEAEKPSMPEAKPSTNDLWYHFKEGFSNAVRKTVYIKDLL